MKFRIAHWLLLLAFVTLIFGVSGCATDDDSSDNTSARPWNAPQSWEDGMGGAGGMDYQHR